jgi:hypothetical protein
LAKVKARESALDWALASLSRYFRAKRITHTQALRVSLATNNISFFISVLGEDLLTLELL